MGGVCQSSSKQQEELIRRFLSPEKFRGEKSAEQFLEKNREQIQEIMNVVLEVKNLLLIDDSDKNSSSSSAADNHFFRIETASPYHPNVDDLSRKRRVNHHMTVDNNSLERISKSYFSILTAAICGWDEEIAADNNNTALNEPTSSSPTNNTSSSSSLLELVKKLVDIYKCDPLVSLDGRGYFLHPLNQFSDALDLIISYCPREIGAFRICARSVQHSPKWGDDSYFVRRWGSIRLGDDLNEEDERKERMNMRNFATYMQRVRQVDSKSIPFLRSFRTSILHSCIFGGAQLRGPSNETSAMFSALLDIEGMCVDNAIDEFTGDTLLHSLCRDLFKYRRYECLIQERYDSAQELQHIRQTGATLPVKMLRDLLSSGRIVSGEKDKLFAQRNRAGFTPLMLAAKEGSAELVKELCAHPEWFTFDENNNNSNSDDATQLNDLDVVRASLEKNVKNKKCYDDFSGLSASTPSSPNELIRLHEATFSSSSSSTNSTSTSVQTDTTTANHQRHHQNQNPIPLSPQFIRAFTEPLHPLKSLPSMYFSTESFVISSAYERWNENQKKDPNKTPNGVTLNDLWNSSDGIILCENWDALMFACARNPVTEAMKKHPGASSPMPTPEAIENEKKEICEIVSALLTLPGSKSESVKKNAVGAFSMYSGSEIFSFGEDHELVQIALEEEEEEEGTTFNTRRNRNTSSSSVAGGTFWKKLLFKYCDCLTLAKENENEPLIALLEANGFEQNENIVSMNSKHIAQSSLRSLRSGTTMGRTMSNPL